MFIPLYMNRVYAEHILHLSNQWTRKDVRKAYKLRAKELHPDKHPNKKDMASKFVELKEAHDYLLGWNDTTQETPNDRNDRNDRSLNTTILEELLTKLTESYQEALIPFIQSLPSQKKQWVIEYLEMYGEVFLGQDVYSILSQIRTDSVDSISNVQDSSTSSLPMYHVHFDEMLNDQIIVHNTDSTQLYIPSWYTEFNSHPIVRHLPHNVSIDASNTIYFHISVSFRSIYHTEQETISLNRTYFSEKGTLIHVTGYVPRNTIVITKTPQHIQSEISSIHIYDSQGTLVSQKTEGVFLPDEPIDCPTKRASYGWAISLIP